MSVLVRVVLSAAVVSGVLGTGRAAAVETVVSTGSVSTPVSTFGGVVAFSERRDAGFALRLRLGDGTLVDAPVRPRSVPFDVSLGPDRTGAVTAVYSRCAHEPRLDYDSPSGALRAYWRGRGCRIYALRVGADAERRLALGTRASTTLPSLWRGAVAFVERSVGRERPGPVRVRDLERDRTTTVAIMGNRGPRNRPPGFLPDAGATRLVLRGRYLLIGWAYQGNFCPRPTSEFDDAYSTQVLLVDRKHPRGDSRQLAYGCATSADSYVLPAGFDDGRAVFGVVRHTRGSGYDTDFIAAGLAGGRSMLLDLPISDMRLESAAASDGLVVRSDREVSPTRVRVVASQLP